MKQDDISPDPATPRCKREARVTSVADDFLGWTPYVPDGYPDRGPHHNPWVIIDPISGMTAYQKWFKESQ